MKFLFVALSGAIGATGRYSISLIPQQYMEQHYAENITVSRLAKLGYVSPSCFNRRFKKEVGITPIEYLISIRIKCAKILLRRKEIPMTDIAMRCDSHWNCSCLRP